MDRKINKSFEILDISPTATLEEAKQAWRDLAQVWHPDKHQANERLQNKATEKLKVINEAWDDVRAWLELSEQERKKKTERAESERDGQSKERAAAEQAERLRREQQEQRRRQEEETIFKRAKYESSMKEFDRENRESYQNFKSKSFPVAYIIIISALILDKMTFDSVPFITLLSVPVIVICVFFLVIIYSAAPD